MILYSYQRKFLESKSNFRIVNKARQIGFSTTIAFECAYNALIGKQSLIVSTGERAARRVLSQSKQWARALSDQLNKINVYKHNFVSDTQTNFELNNGGNVISLPASSDTIRGFTGHNVYFDEASFISNIGDVIQAIAPALTRNPDKKKLTFISTPFGKKGLFFEIFNDIEKYPHYERFSFDLNQAIEQGFPSSVDHCMRILGVASVDDPAFKQEYLCEFIDEASSYFPFDLIEGCIDQDSEYIKFDQTPSGILYAGYDPAKQVDSGVFTIVSKNDRGEIRVIYQRAWQGINYSEQLAEIERWMQFRRISAITTDQTGLGQKIQEDLERKFGAKAIGMTFTQASKEKMIVNLRQLMQDGKIKFPKDQTLIHELHSLERIQTEHSTSYRHSSGMHDDRVWSLAMACYEATKLFHVKPFIRATGGIR